MPNSSTDICNIRLCHRKKGFFGFVTEMWWIAETATASGIKIIAQSETMELSGGGIVLQDIAQPLNLALSQNLASKGWIPIKTDDFGNVTAMTRQAVQDSKQEKSDIPELLNKLATLKDAGVITQEEFDQKKEDLLSRL